MTGLPENIDQIFWSALQLDTDEERREYLERACGADAEQRRLVEKLLRAQPKAAAFLERPFVPAPPTAAGPISEGPGTVIEPYKLLEQIGEGGFGVVFMAEQQEPIRRKVALKVLKPGMDTRQVVARFEVERQALALMDHPNIAKVLDAGQTTSGRPYFVMDLVKGLPITDYCDQNKLTPRERLELFVHVCQAVQHAHLKGIIHRDLKPSNVLVTVQDGAPLVKVIDFGIAKALGQQLTDKTLFTGFAQLVGTPLYMSPEQAALSNVDVDTRSDVYSLGVLLYELLTGTTPFDKERLQEIDYDELRRIIREEEPPRPSTRISTLGRAATTASEKRRSDPRKLSRLFRGELDWIVMKALEKDRNRRYESASAFAGDVQRYLANEPVLACPPTAWYRLRKLARRHKGAFVSGAVLFAALLMVVVSLAISTLLATRAYDAERSGRLEADRSFETARQAVEDYFTQVSENQLLDAPGLGPLRKQLLETALGYYLRFIDQHADDPRRQADVAAAHLRVAHITFCTGGSNDQWFPHQRDAVAIIERILEEKRDTPEVVRRLAGVYRSGATDRRSFGSVDWKQILNCLERLVSCWERLVRNHPDVPELRSDLAGAYVYLGDIHGSTEGVHFTDKAIVLFEKLSAANPREPKYRAELARACEVRAKHLIECGRREEAETASLTALKLRRELAQAFPEKAVHSALLAANLRSVAQLQIARGQPKEAEKSLRQARDLQENLIVQFPEVAAYQLDLARTHIDVGSVCKALGRPKDAEESYQRAEIAFRLAIDLYEKIAAARTGDLALHQEMAQRYIDLGDLLNQSGQAQRAKQAYANALTVIAKAAESTAAPRVRQGLASLASNLGHLLLKKGEGADAGKAFGTAAKIWQKLAIENPEDSSCVEQLGEAYRMAALCHGNDQRELLFRKALSIFEKLAVDFPDEPKHRRWVANVYFQLATLFDALNKRVQSEEWYRKALQILGALPADFFTDYWVRLDLKDATKGLADVLKSRGRPQEAEAVYGQTIKVWGKIIELHPDRYEAWHERASVHLQLKQWEKAIADLSRAIELAPTNEASGSYEARGTAYYWLERRDKALADFSKAIELNPSWWGGWAWRGYLHREMEQWDKAVADCSKALELKPTHSMSWRDRAFAYVKLNQPEKAVADLRQAIQTGLPDAQQILKTDADLEPLRSREDFRKLMAELKAKAKKQ
jgi:serine/threonine protein kinase/tetratricopeptide (TPR) repeat protein